MLFLVWKACHIIAMVAWFAGLFYLPRLFVYHIDAKEEIGKARFRIMERRLYYGIMWPAALLTTFFGFLLLAYRFDFYMQSTWMRVKLGLVALLWIYHLSLGHYRKQFLVDRCARNAMFFRVWNELPTLMLIGIVFAVVLK